MRRSLTMTTCLTVVLIVCAVAQAQREEKKKEEVGIKVGEKAPEFKLKDQDGKEVALKDLLKEDKVALVFYRSADW